MSSLCLALWRSFGLQSVWKAVPFNANFDWRSTGPHWSLPWLGNAHSLQHLWQSFRDSCNATSIGRSASAWVAFASSQRLELHWEICPKTVALAARTGEGPGQPSSSRVLSNHHEAPRCLRWPRSLTPRACGACHAVVRTNRAPTPLARPSQAFSVSWLWCGCRLDRSNRQRWSPSMLAPSDQPPTHGRYLRTNDYHHGTFPLTWISCRIGRTDHGHVRILWQFGAERRRNPKQPEITKSKPWTASKTAAPKLGKQLSSILFRDLNTFVLVQLQTRCQNSMKE